MSCSLGGDPRGENNSIVFHDAKGDEHLQVHSQRNLVQTGEAASVHATPGPHIGVYGTLPIPMGSGSGGGLLDWPAAILNPLYPSDFSALLPGKTAIVTGDRVNIALGNSFSHVIGSNINMVVDLGQLARDAGVGGSQLSKVVGGVTGASGNSSFVFGQNVTLDYGGPYVLVTRGKKLV